MHSHPNFDDRLLTMETTMNRTRPTRRPISPAFTLIELLVVIAIIAILAAILFPAFAAVKEQARQSDTMSNMHEIYEGARMFYEDEGHYPSSLFGYAETVSPNIGVPGSPPAMPAVAGDPITPMEKATEDFTTATSGSTFGYLFGHQVKDYNAFLCPDNTVTNQSAVTEVYYPLSLTNNQPTVVTWQQDDPATTPCPFYGDPDLPARQLAGGSTNPTFYVGQPKLYYVMDTMDIGPMIDSTGKQMVDSNGAKMYELHYSTDWTHMRYDAQNACDLYGDNGAPPGTSATNGSPITAQLKYQNPPSENTILTWNTQHVATAGSSSVIILLLSGTARKISISQALQQLPLNYR